MILKLLESVLSSAAARAPVGGLVSLVQPGSATVDGKRLDGKTRYLLGLMELAGPASIAQLTPAAAREEYLRSGGSVAPPARRLARVCDLEIAAAGGRIPLRIYVPFAKATALPALVYFHGGGWVLGSIATHDRLCRTIADDAGCVVVSVDYRLAPESKFPTAVDDALAAFAWVVKEAGALGVDADRIAVGGDSAGGNLAAVVAQAAASGVVAPPRLQLLLYPVTDLRCDTRSYDVFANGYFLTRDIMLWFRSHYLRETADIDDPRASPLHAELKAPVAAALVVTAGFDPLLDEGLAYARKLRAAGTEVTYRCHETLIHGFASVTGAVPAARAALAETTTALRLAFARL
jgi:acetyl esterase